MKNKKQRRHYNGRYLSQKEWERREFRKLKMIGWYFVAMFAVWYIAEHNTIVVDVPEVVHEAQASGVDENLCGLQSVVCEDEQPVVEAIKAVSDALGREVTDETKKRIAYLYEKATAAGVPFKDAVKTVYCESMWTNTQSAIVKNGVQEPSYGLAQIHIPSHRGITREEAMDAYFAIDFMVDNWQNVAWYGYDRATGACTNGLIINL